MAGEPDGDRPRTALVVLAVPANPPTGPGGYTTADRPPTEPEGAEAVQEWFSRRGFDVDPVVGISFAISGPGELFSGTFGSAEPGAATDAGSATDPGTAVEYDRAALSGRLDAEVLGYVAAVVVGPPPDFGPGNP